jgi:hypothetical protein
MMDLKSLIESLGIPISVAIVLGYAAMYLMKFITGNLMKRLDEQFGRLETIVIKLIDSNDKERKALLKHETEILAKFDTFITVVQKLTGNGLKTDKRKGKEYHN